MYIHHFTDSEKLSVAFRRVGKLVICVFLLAGCASIPGQNPFSRKSPVQNEATKQRSETRVAPARAQTMYEQAVAIMASGDYLEAQFRLQEFLLQYPDYPGAHVNLAIIYANNGDDQGAGNSIADALKIDPQHPAALNQLGMLLRRGGEFQQAESAYLKAVAADPEYALAYYNLGVLNELYLQRLDSALMHYERYLELVGDDRQIGKWIADLKRRIAASQRAANVTE